MGYNNHNCGMHYIRYSHGDWFFDDRYDEDVTLMLNKEKIEKEKQRLKVSTMPQDEKNVEKDKTENTVESSANTNPEKKNHRYKNHSSGVHQPKIEYGTEKIISNETIESYLSFSSVVMSNIMRIAFEKKLDIRGILEECEKIMVKDLRANPSPENKVYGLFNHPKNEHSFLSLAVLADKLGCSIYDLFINDEVRRKNFAYSLLDSIEKMCDKYSEEYGKYYYQWFDVDYSINNSASIFMNNFDYLYGLSRKSFMSHKNFSYHDMTLEVTKDIYDGQNFYFIRFGINLLNSETKKNYFLMHADLWEEQSGRVCDFMEDIIQHCPPEDDI